MHAGVGMQGWCGWTAVSAVVSLIEWSFIEWRPVVASVCAVPVCVMHVESAVLLHASPSMPL